MKYILPFLLLFCAAISLAQTPSLYDMWSPELAGSEMHVTITKHFVILTEPHKGFGLHLPEFMTAPLPQSGNTISTPVDTIKDNVQAKSDTALLLKIVYDSARVKGRIFVQLSKNDKFIIPLRFDLSNNGEAQISLACDPEMMITKDMHSLKQVEKLTRNRKNIKFPIFSSFSFTFYNNARAAEFAAMKDPMTMPKDEVLAMMNSFGNRAIAELQLMPQDTSSDFFQSFSMMGLTISKVMHIVHDLFIAHGYDPLAAAESIERFKDDTDFQTAAKAMSDKIEESVPALRIAKFNREAEKDENVKMQLGEINSVCQQRVGLIANLLEDVSGQQGIDQKAIDKVSQTRIKAAGLILTPEVMKDSSAFMHYQNAQDDLTAALRALMENIEKNTDEKLQDDLSTILSQIEGQESRIRVESLKWNDLNASHQGEIHYQNFKPFSGEAQQVQFPH